MASTNYYEKPYLTSRRPVNDEKYVLVLFKSDNTFIIKKKSNLHGIDENGLVDIKDRGKVYIGYCLFEGCLAQVEAFAERLDKEMNTDLESDCEALVNHSKTDKQPAKHSFNTTASSKAKFDSMEEPNEPSTIKSTNHQKQSATQPKIQSLARVGLETTSKMYKTPLATNSSALNKRTRETPAEPSSGSASNALRALNNISSNATNVRPSRRMLTFDNDDDDDEDVSIGEGDDDNDDDDQLFASATDLNGLAPSTSTTNNRDGDRPAKRKLSKTSRISIEENAKRFSSKSSSSENHHDKEGSTVLKALSLSVDDLNKDVYQISKDSKLLVVLIEKIDKKLNVLYENQKKMQKALAKKKINVELSGGEFGDENILPADEPFKHTLPYTNSTGETVDLLQLYGIDSQMGRYVARVIDNIFTKDEIVNISVENLIKDDRYLLIKEAARCRFKLNNKMLRDEWPSLHESILQKRRNETKRAKAQVAAQAAELQ